MNRPDYPTQNIANPFTILIMLLLIIFTFETIVMYLLPLVLPDTHGHLENLADSFSLALLSAPFIWLLIARPLRLAVMNEFTRSQSLRKLSLAIEQTPMAVVITDREGIIEYVNPHFTKITGYSTEEAIGREPRIVKSGYHSPVFYQELWETILGGKEWHGEFRNKRKNGELYWEASSISPVKNDAGEITHFVAVKEDISERKQTEEALRHAKRAAEAATAAKSEFLANMSHEIRTPMNAVLGMLYLLQQTPLVDRQKNYLNKAQSASNSLLKIINDILDFSKIEAGKLEMESAPFRLGTVLGQLADVASAAIKDKPVKLLIVVDPDVPNNLTGDPLRLGQVLLNLTNNAIKFTEEGEIIVSVKQVTSSDNEIELCFVVQDSGIGMTPEQLAKLFTAFTQADTSTTRRYGGAGLGLSISMQLVEMMGSRIKVASDPGKGSTFSFTVRFGCPEQKLCQVMDAVRTMEKSSIESAAASAESLQEELPVDLERIAPLARELATLLETNSMTALGVWERLKPLLAGVNRDGLDAAMNNLDFKDGRMILADISAAIGIELS
jgi:PAS domain S-box-containing protein